MTLAADISSVSTRTEPLSDIAVLAPRPGDRRRLAYGDMVRILGTVAVVVGHVSDLQLSTNPLSHNWWIFNWADCACRWAVPAYIMLSGALLLDPDREQIPSVFYRKRLARIGIPLIFWSAFFMWFSVYYTHWVPSGRDAWLNLLAGRPYMHLHFIFRITALYALTPMLRVFLKYSSRTMLIGTIAVLLVLAMADSMRNAFTETDLSAFINFTPFLGYYLGGYLLRDVKLSSTGVLAAGAAFVGSVAALALGSGALIHHYGFGWYPSRGAMLYDFVSPVRVVMAFSSWLLLAHIFRHPWPASAIGQKGVQWLASTTLGLYLVHPIFREMLLKHNFTAAWPNPWIGIPLNTMMVYLPALALTIILMQIPYVRRITG